LLGALGETYSRTLVAKRDRPVQKAYAVYIIRLRLRKWSSAVLARLGLGEKMGAVIETFWKNIEPGTPIQYVLKDFQSEATQPLMTQVFMHQYS
jgi:hypothetical protein